MSQDLVIVHAHSSNALVRARRFGRFLVAGVAAGAIAGFIAGGIGSRLAMRLVALIAGEGMYGMRAEADAAVGVITLGGTLFLVIFSTIFCIPFGIVFVALRPFLPGHESWQRGLAFGLLLLGIFGSVVIEGSNFDFRIFISPYIAVGLFMVLFPLFGVVAGIVAGRIAPNPGRAPHRVLWLVWTPMLVPLFFGLRNDVDALGLIF